MGEDAEVGHKDHRKRMRYDLWQAVRILGCRVSRTLLVCGSSNNTTTATTTKITTTARQQQEQQKPITTTGSYDGGNEDVDEDSEN